MKAPGNPRDSDTSSLESLQHVVAVPTSTLLEPKPDSDGHSPTLSYGAFVPVVDEFLPLGGSGSDDLVLRDGFDDDADQNRPSATTLIYLCALSSSLTSVLLGYGEEGGEKRHDRPKWVLLSPPLCGLYPENCKAIVSSWSYVARYILLTLFCSYARIYK